MMPLFKGKQVIDIHGPEAKDKPEIKRYASYGQLVVKLFNESISIFERTYKFIFVSDSFAFKYTFN